MDILSELSLTELSGRGQAWTKPPLKPSLRLLDTLR